MNRDKAYEVSEKQKAEAVSQAMKLVIDFNGSQLKEIRRFVDTLLQMRQQQGKKMKNDVGEKIMGKEEKGKQAERKALKKTAAYLKKGPKGKTK